MVTKLAEYIECIRTCYPDLRIANACFHNHTDGQFNEVLFVNDTLIFRFPRAVEVAETFATEVAILERIQPSLSLPIPKPVFQNFTTNRCDRVFIGYWMLPGQLLRRETIENIQDEVILDHIANQLALFLQELHNIRVDELGFTLAVQDGREMWVQMYEDFRTYLFLYMRPAAQAAVTANFDKFLNDPQQFAYTPTLRHGDFGPGNILYDPARKTISGVIDFDSIGLGDPAVDAGAILHLGEDFFRRMCHTYPNLASMRKRTEFLRSTYALQEALYGLRDNVAEAFEAGIAQYR